MYSSLCCLSVFPASLPVCLQLEISIKEDLVASLRRDLAASRAERESAHVEIRRLTVSTVKGHTDDKLSPSLPDFAWGYYFYLAEGHTAH